MPRWNIATSWLGAAVWAAAAAFVLLTAVADRAMDKTGRGDFAAYERFSQMAGHGSWLAVMAWIACLVFALRTSTPFRGRVTFWFGLMPPLVAIAASISGFGDAIT